MHRTLNSAEMTPDRWKQIEQLYWAAVDRDAEGRAALLAGSSPDVRHIVNAMLAQEPTGQILDRPAWDGEPATQTGLLSKASAAGFGHYRIDERIGAGGMGEVYRAWDTRLARRVAIKAIRSGSSTRGLEARLLEEARAASALNHPNIVTIYDIGTIHNRPYLVMEWIEGETLRRRLSRGPVSVSDILAIVSQIADALTAAHHNGILHRDLKPENIMLAADGRTKVLDFGIAKRLTLSEDAGTREEILTDPGAVVGTPGYMSPEQARGEKLDFRSDHFSLGAIVYEMATGRRAFAGESTAQVQAAILLQHPEPLTRLNPQAPAPLQWIVDRCLAKSREDRFSSTTELKNEVLAILANAGQRVSTVGLTNNIPSPRTALIGREDELARLSELAADPNLRLLTLTGPGGIGKTRLAIELGRQLAGGFSGGAYFVSLEKVNQAALVSTEVMRVLGVTPAAGQSPEAAIAEHLQRNISGSALLILDNFEHVLDAAAFVAGLASDRLKMIVTSRAPLRIYGEYEFPVPSLLTIDSSTESAPVSPAVRLFLERASGLRTSAPDRDQLRLVAEICERLDGLPLAIELAAARTKLLPLKTLRERLQDPLAVLVGGARDLPQRQHTLRATLDWSFNLLGPEHQKLFRRMSVFVGGATIEAIEAVCDTRQDLQMNLWEAIELLVDNSLVRRLNAEDGEPRFAMLETMREYGMERLEAAGEDAYTHKAHAAYFLVLAEEAAPTMRRERLGKHPFDPELGNFRAAFDWLTPAEEVEWGLRLMLALGVYFISRRLHAEALQRVSRLLKLPGVERFPRLRNWARYYQVDFEFEGDPAAKHEYLAQWKQFTEAGDRLGMFHSAHRMGFNMKFADLAESRYWSEQAVEIARSGFPTTVLAGALSNLADVVKMEGDFTYAQALHLEVTRIFEAAGDRENALWSLSHEADLARDQGLYTEAGGLYRKALSGFRELGFPLGIASCLHDLAGLQAGEGKTEEARRMYKECLRLYGPENVLDLPRVLESLAALETRMERPEVALLLGGAAASIRERFDVRAGPTLVPMEKTIQDARAKAGMQATTHWMRGWNMSVDEIVGWAGEDGTL